MFKNPLRPFSVLHFEGCFSPNLLRNQWGQHYTKERHTQMHTSGVVVLNSHTGVHPMTKWIHHTKNCRELPVEKEGIFLSVMHSVKKFWIDICMHSRKVWENSAGIFLYLQNISFYCTFEPWKIGSESQLYFNEYICIAGCDQICI